jgi:transposase
MFSDLLDAYGIQHNNKSRVKAIPLTEEELYQLHVVEGLTAVRIAARFGYHSSGVSRLIKKYNLDPGRPLVNEKKLPPLTHDELWKLYWVDNMSAGQIATRYNVTRSTALRWFKQLEIPTRDWNGGKDFHRTYTRNTGDRREQEFNAIERNQILTRDQWHCQMPGCDCKEAWKLEVHHIMPIEYGGTNALANGITLCKNCHDSIRLRELDFITLFQEILQQQNN